MPFSPESLLKTPASSVSWTCCQFLTVPTAEGSVTATVTLPAELATAGDLTAGDHSLARLELDGLPGPAVWTLPRPLSLRHLPPLRWPGRPRWEVRQVLLQEGLDLSRPVVEPQTGLVEILDLYIRVHHSQSPHQIWAHIICLLSLSAHIAGFIFLKL